MIVRDLGEMEYHAAWDIQREVAESVLAGGDDTLLLVVHPPVLTLGANFHEENLLFTPAQYEERGIAVERTDRGGDVTYHGPGQLVAYPIFDVSRHGKDLHRWMRDLEETMLLTCAHFGLAARRFPPHTGAWIGNLKIAAIGVKMRRWVSTHGIALNVEETPEAFSLIVPCGIQGYGVTSLSQELGRPVALDEVRSVVVSAFTQVFGPKNAPQS